MFKYIKFKSHSLLVFKQYVYAIHTVRHTYVHSYVLQNFLHYQYPRNFSTSFLNVSYSILCYLSNISALLGYLSSVPRNLNYTYEIQHNIRNVLFINLTWDAPEYTHGDIQNYMVEYMTNDASVPVTSDVTSVGTYIITLDTYVCIYMHVHILRILLLQSE